MFAYHKSKCFGCLCLKMWLKQSPAVYPIKNSMCPFTGVLRFSLDLSRVSQQVHACRARDFSLTNAWQITVLTWTKSVVEEDFPPQFIQKQKPWLSRTGSSSVASCLVITSPERHLLPGIRGINQNIVSLSHIGRWANSVEAQAEQCSTTCWRDCNLESNKQMDV